MTVKNTDVNNGFGENQKWLDMFPTLFSIMRRVLRLSMWEYSSPNCDYCYYVVTINQHNRTMMRPRHRFVDQHRGQWHWGPLRLDRLHDSIDTTLKQQRLGVRHLASVSKHYKSKTQTSQKSKNTKLTHLPFRSWCRHCVRARTKRAHTMNRVLAACRSSPARMKRQSLS